MRGYWYIEGADGRHYCWSKEPSFSCPIGTAERLGDLFEQACAHADISPAWMLRRLQHNGGRFRDEKTGRWVAQCDSCGHKLDRLGFRYWIEGPPPADDGLGALNAALNKTLLGGSGFTTVEGPWYAPTKKDAEAWARGRVAETKGVTA